MKVKKSLLLLITYVLLIVIYKYIIAKNFGYLGFQVEYYSFSKAFFVSLIVIFFVLLGSFFKNSFYSLIYTISLTMLFFGQAIFYIFNDSNFSIVVYMGLPVFLLFIIDKIDNDKIGLKVRKLNLKDTYTYVFLIIITAFLILPYFKNINMINWKNLLFIDVYDSRQLDDIESSFLMGYVFAPIARVLLPFLFVYSINNKAKLLTLFSTISIIFIFLLNGALKSILIGFLAAIFFLKGDYIQKKLRYLNALFLTFSIGIIENMVGGSYLIADYLRRIFFTPSRLFQVYYDYFNENYTYFNHSRIAKLLGVSEYDVFIPHFIGRYVMGREGLSANVGIFTEGFFSFGLYGVIISSIIFVFIIYMIRKSNIPPMYFGIVFSFLYVINTSFIETLFITHGLLFFIVFAYFVIPTQKV